ncbi:TolC family protein [Edaphobacter albus]|uniref:TolC family protein n=1 Tax=Edaphobacter sp. 4G125 TaxID=2763071 RepID=UPI00164823E2|nr:TolC family protein [Edaphobacter sp. 4G125]QNI35841.1 TolC family protein [Edaphobacter sp. 4G125]
MQGRTLFLCALLLLTPALKAQQAASTILTVDDLVRAGIQNNRDLAAVRERIPEAQGLKRQAGVRPSPTLGLTGITGKPLGTLGEDQYGADYSQLVETFGKRGKRVQVAEYAISIAEADYQARVVQLGFEIKTAYAEVLAEQRKLKVLNDLIAVNQEMLRLTEARVKEGDVAPLEANLLKVEISRAEVSRRSAQGRLVSAELELRSLVGLEQATPIPNVDFSVPTTVELDALKQKALESRADLKAARMEEEQEVAGIALAKAEAKPNVTLSAGYTRQNSQFDDLYGFNTSGTLSPLRDRDDILKFGVSIPLRTSRSGAGSVQAAAARSSGARLRREYLDRTIPLAVESAYQNWRTAQDSLQMLREGVLDPSAANLSVIREAYRLGQLRLLDVLNEQRRLVDTQLTYIDAQADVARTHAELERAVGGNLP